MFSILKEHIGEKVFITYWNYGRIISDVEVLQGVIDFERIETNRGGIPFIGYGSAIVSIRDENGKELYKQPLNEPYDVRDSLGIIAYKKKLFGDDIAREELERHNEGERRSRRRKKGIGKY